MKLPKTSALVALLTACYLYAPAQGTPLPVNEPNYNKPKIFADLPERLNLKVATLEAALDLPIGASVNAAIAIGFTLNGTVVSKSSPADPSVKSIVIKSASRKDATFTFTRITRQDGSASYIGRMMSKGASDALEITKEGTTYIIRKKAYHDIVNE